MLVLSRKLKQEIQIGDDIKITVLKIKGNTVRLGIEAPRDIHIVRGEIPRKSDVVGSASTTESQEPQDGETVSIADFTVVFTNDDQPSTKMDLLPFEASKDEASMQTKACQTEAFSTGVAVSKASKNSNSIQYRDQLPKVLQHNRLKEIVNQLTSK